MKITSIIFFVSGLLFLALAGCSELKNSKTPVEPAMTVHGIGFADTTQKSSANFHTKYIQTKNYDLKLCQSCHGTDYAGGTTGQSCNSCHNKPNGPENCTSCHGSINAAPPKDLSGNTARTVRAVGAHQKHLIGGTLGAAVACNTCHKVPQKFGDAGHIDATPHAEIYTDTTSAFYRSNAVYNASNVTCTNTYCHGNFNGGNLNAVMTWTDTSSTSVQCGTCHGDVTKATLKEKAFPKTGHTAAAVTADCATCHVAVVNSSMTIINPSRHANGRID
jgi:predicted CxxxxCH...CXXCH cytochrome family protein